MRDFAQICLRPSSYLIVYSFGMVTLRKDVSLMFLGDVSVRALEESSFKSSYCGSLSWEKYFCPRIENSHYCVNSSVMTSLWVFVFVL